MNTQGSQTRKATGSSETRRVYNELRDRIITGQISPGARLKVETLKTEMGVGASPIREALSLLTSDQLVERLDRRGFRAADVGADHFAEILRLRCAFEDMALRDSLRDADQTWEDNLVLIHHRLARADRADTKEFEETHRAFHMALLAACNSPILIRFCGQLYDLNIRYRYLAHRATTYGRRDVAGEHREIMEAAIDRDVDLASERLMAHYRKTGDFLLRVVEQDGLLGGEDKVEPDP